MYYNGLYQVSTNSFVAGFVVEGGVVTECAPILRKKIEYWKTKAVLIGDKMSDVKQIQINGTVFEVAQNATIQKNGGGSYSGTRFTYRDESGALKEQGFHEKALKFNAALNNQLNELKAGDKFTMVKEKEGEFWNVKGIYAEGKAPVQTATIPAPAAANGGGNFSPKGTYPTAEERAKTQVYIVRQSCSSTAADLATVLKLKSKEEVVEVAKFLESYVMGIEFDDGSINTLPSDDPDDIN
jgi:hypothetical protein